MPEQQKHKGTIVLVMGYPASGKTTYTEDLVKEGYFRINRDEQGGSLADLIKLVGEAIWSGRKKIVLDNTYPTVASRVPIIVCAQRNGYDIQCLWLDTSFEDAQFNACRRMLTQTGKLLMPEDFAAAKNPNHFPPAALFNYRKVFEAPKTDEGFSEVKRIKFVRRKDAGIFSKALILDYDGTLRRCKGGKYDFPTKVEEVEILSGRTKVLKEYEKQHYLLLGVSNQSGIAKGQLTKDDAIACFDRTNELLGVDIKYYFCPHNVPPVNCYCRKPHPGLGVKLIHEFDLAPEDCIFVGDQTTDKTFANRCGFQYFDQADFFKA